MEVKEADLTAESDMNVAHSELKTTPTERYSDLATRQDSIHPQCTFLLCPNNQLQPGTLIDATRAVQESISSLKTSGPPQTSGLHQKVHIHLQAGH